MSVTRTRPHEAITVQPSGGRARRICISCYQPWPCSSSGNRRGYRCVDCGEYVQSASGGPICMKCRSWEATKRRPPQRLEGSWSALMGDELQRRMKARYGSAYGFLP